MDEFCLPDEPGLRAFRSLETTIRLLSPSLTSKKLLEPLRRQGGIAGRVLDIAMSQVRLDRPRIMTVVGEFIAAGMTQHVGVGLDTRGVCR
jgi:hypothetical protein